MSFRLKTILGIAIIELSVMAILIVVNQFNLGGSATTQLYDRAQSTARIFANMVSDAVISLDLATLDAMIETAVASEDLVYLRVRASNGTVLSEGGEADAVSASFVPDASYDDALSDHRIDASTEISAAGEVFGTIEIGVSTESVEAEIANALYWNLTVAVIGMSLVAIFGFALGSILTRQLSFLRSGANAISKGDLNYVIPIRGRDELADTAACFNQMAKALASERGSLEAKQAELLAKKDRVEVIVGCMSQIADGQDGVDVPDIERQDEIGNMARATVVFRDAMEAVERARLEQQRLITAFDQVGEQVSIYDTDGKVLFLNAAFREFNSEILDATGRVFTREDYLRAGLRLGRFPDAIEPETWITQQLDPASASDVPVEERHAADRVLLTRRTQVPGIGVVISASDVTELRQSQAQLIQASKMATLGEMATGVAHELNQPLGVIRMASSNCVKRIERGQLDAEYLTKKLARIGDQTERAAQIIDHMRIFGRKPDGTTAPLDLSASLKDVGLLFRAQVQTLGIRFTVDIPDAEAFVLGERVLFEQVLLNLLSNARDAIEMHGDENGHITLSAEFDTPEGHVITIQDNGGGIPEHVLDKLFEPFFTTKEPGKGTGLGLSISFGTVRDMQGEISATNENSGACFRILLPPAAIEGLSKAS